MLKRASCQAAALGKAHRGAVIEGRRIGRIGTVEGIQGWLPGADADSEAHDAAQQACKERCFAGDHCIFTRATSEGALAGALQTFEERTLQLHSQVLEATLVAGGRQSGLAASAQTVCFAVSCSLQTQNDT